MRRRLWLFVCVSALVISAAALYYSMQLRPPIQVGMDKLQVYEALGRPSSALSERFCAGSFPYASIECDPSGSPWSASDEICYDIGPDWLGYEHSLIVDYGEGGRVLHWQPRTFAPQRPAWVDGILQPLGW